MIDNLEQLTAGELGDILKTIEFKYENTTQQYNSPFFKEFSGLYNTDPILLRCSCKQPELFSKIIKSLNLFEEERHGVRQLNPEIIKSLITNVFLNPGPSWIGHFTDEVDWKKFNFLSFEEIPSISFAHRLQKLVEIGGLFFKSKLPLNQVKNLSIDFSNSIFSGKINDFKIYYTFDEGWSAYFGKMGMGLDITFFLFDGISGEFWILSKTDYD